MKKFDPSLYFITDSTNYTEEEFLYRVEQALQGGARLDHTLGNVSILLYLDSLGKKGCIIDDYSEMKIVSIEPAYIEDSYSFFSLLNISGTAKGITIENAKYPLENGEITCEYQYGISNEVLCGEMAKVSVDKGRALLIKVK